MKVAWEIGRLLDVARQISLAGIRFPGPGLAVRVLGDITKEKLTLLLWSGRYFLFRNWNVSNLYDKNLAGGFVVSASDSFPLVWWAMGAHTKNAVCIACSKQVFDGNDSRLGKRFPNDVLAHISKQNYKWIAAGINRVVYDISSKPPANNRVGISSQL